MNSERWKELLMSRLYDELSLEESTEFDEHVRNDAEAHREWQEFESVRLRLADAGEPVPATPARLVLAERRSWKLFAAGFAAAAGIFCAGFLIGQRPVAVEGTAGTLSARQLEEGLAALGIEPAVLRKAVQSQEELIERTEALSASIRRSEDAANNSSAVLPASSGSDAIQLTRSEFEAGLTRIMNRIDYERQRDLEYVLGEISTVDQRQSTRIDSTRQALQFAIQASPAFSGPTPQ